MAYNHDPQVQYPPYQANRYTQQQYEQPPAPTYPSARHDPRIPSGQPYTPYQHPIDAHPVQRPQTAAPQLSRYPTVPAQVSRPIEQRVPLTPQAPGIARHSSDTGSTQTQSYPGHIPPRPATGFSPARLHISSSQSQAAQPPTSPTKTSNFRRPLPQRPGDGANGAVLRRPLPDLKASQVTAPTLHRPSYSVDAYRTVSPLPQPPANHSMLGGTPVLSGPPAPRPLPEPIPRSTKSLDLTRSTSPIKNALDPNGPLPQIGQKFVPLWKRALPSPAQSTSPPTATYNDKRASVAGPPLSFHPTPLAPPPLQRSKTTGVRPLPPSPGSAKAVNAPSSKSAFANTGFQDPSSLPKAVGGFALRARSRTLPDAPPPPQGALPHRPDSMLPPPVGAGLSPAVSSTFYRSISESPMSSDSEDLYDNALLRRPETNATSVATSPSPAHGFRDLPRASTQPGNAYVDLGQTGNEAASSIDSLPSKAQAGGPRSLASRIAALTLTRPPQAVELNTVRPSSPPKQAHSMPGIAQNSGAKWPANLPPLPRAPANTASYESQKSPYTNGADVLGNRSQQPIKSSSAIASSVGSRLPRTPARDASPTRPLPSTPHSTSPRQASPIRAFPSLRHPSPVRSQNLPPLPSSPAGPSSPTRTQAPGPLSSSPRGRSFPQSDGSRARTGIPNLDDAPPSSLRRSPSPAPTSKPPFETYALPSIRTQDATQSPHSPMQLVSTPPVRTPSSAASTFTLSSFPSPPRAQADWRSTGQHSPVYSQVPQIAFPGDFSDSPKQNDWGTGPGINITVIDTGESPKNGMPQISFPGDDQDVTIRGPRIAVGITNGAAANVSSFDPKQYYQLRPVVEVDDYPPCLGCSALIIGDAVNAMGGRWHPRCYRCCVCNESLEMLAPIEHEGKIYCSLDYHEKFSPRCYHCHTVIVDPSYITLNDKELGVRTYHDQHFFCSECGDPFVTPNMKTRTFEGDGPFEESEVGAGFTVFHGFPYCANCHAKLRWPKCKKCRKSMAPDSDIIEALGAKWCSDCFVCTSCHSPFRNGRLFLRDSKPFCQDCFEIIIKHEM